MTTAVRVVLASAVALLVWCSPTLAAAQQPFLVDDAAVTSPRVWHLEISTQSDALRRAARPVLWQATLDVEMVYGVFDRLEASALVPLVSLFTGDDVIAGVGDSSFGLKYRFTRDSEARHQVAAGVTLEVPTGSAARQLGSGLVDYGLTLISQHGLSAHGTLRANVSAVLVGNTQTGVVGVSTRGGVLVVGTSYVHQLSPRVQAGSELVAFVSARQVGTSSVTWQVGGNVGLRRSATLDLAVLGGWLDATPRLGLQVGISVDLNDPPPREPSRTR